MRTAALVSWLLCAAPLGGCTEEESLYFTDERKASGLVVILPGIEGPSPLNRDIREGLFHGGAEQALVIRPWGIPVPGVGAILNQMNPLGNRLAGAGVARMIAEYQDSHPGQPVYVVGHSGGGGVAVFTAEALAELDGNRRLDGLVLLSASISSDYDLTKALGCSRNGLVNFYNTGDSLLGATVLFGNVDGGRALSAGLVGFQRDFPGLYQVEVGPGLSGGDPHASTTRVPFVSAHVAPWMCGSGWPAMTIRSGGERGTGNGEQEKPSRGKGSKPQGKQPTSLPSPKQPSSGPRSAAPESSFPVPYSLFPVPRHLNHVEV